MSVAPLYSNGRRQDDLMAEYREKICSVDPLEQESSPWRSCDPILGGLHLGSSHAFIESTHLTLIPGNFIFAFPRTYRNQHEFRAVITICPMGDIIYDYNEMNRVSLERVAGLFQTNNVQWLYPGRTVVDMPVSWPSFVHDCTFPDSEEALQDLSVERGFTTELQRLNDLKAKKVHDVVRERWFQPMFEVMDGALFENRKTLVHCRAGISRSATLVAAYLISRFQCTSEEALAFLKQQRSCVNSGFALQLKEYELRLKEERKPLAPFS